MHIHVLGTGAIGCYFSSLLKMNKHKVTLLLRSEDHLTELKNKQNTIIYRTKDKYIPVEGFEGVNIFDNKEDTPIEALVVATKALYTLEALKPILHRLTENTTILLLQNGMGVADELVEELFQQMTPRILIGVNRHGVERVAPFEIIHHSGYQEQTAVVIGEYPTREYSHVSEFANALTGITELRAAYLSWADIRIKMTNKLVINMAVNSITTVLNFRNKGLTYHENPAALNLMKGICNEAYQVLKNDLPNETPETLLQHTLDILKTAGENTCSTLQDLKAKRLTEIDYLNGYVCKRGKMLEIPTPVNQTLVDLVHTQECCYHMPV